MSLRLSGGRRLLSPPGATARPTASRVRLAVMNLLAAEIPGSRWLDLCCGSGVMACEALRRGAAEVVAVERDRRVAAVARANLEAVAGDLARRTATGGCPPPRWKVVGEEVLRWLGRGAGSTGQPPFDLIYVDPPYASGLYGGIGGEVEAGGWLRPGGTMVWECAVERPPALPEGWQLRDRRAYGGTLLVLLQRCDSEAVAETAEQTSSGPDLSPPGPNRGGTGSRPPRTAPPG